MQEKKLTGYPSIDKPWLKYYSEEAINAPLPECTIYEYLWENNKDHLDDIAIIYFSRKITYRELFRNIDKTAAAFSALGVKQGEIVTVALPNIPENIYCIYALNKLGAIADMIDLRSKGDTLIHYLNESESRFAVICDLFASNAFDIADKTQINKWIVSSPFDSLPSLLRGIMKLKRGKLSTPANAILWQNFFYTENENHKIPVGKPNAVTCIFHTSGTTGLPKGVMMTNLNFNAMVEQVRISGIRFDYGKRIMNQVPPFLAFNSLCSMHLPFAQHMQMVLLPEYRPDKFAENIVKTKASCCLAGPADWGNFLENKELLTKNIDLSGLVSPISGSDAMTQKAKADVNKVLKSRGCSQGVLEGYGMTEIGSAACANTPQFNVDASVGIPLPFNTFCIYDNENDCELPYGEPGEICMTGPTVMKGYYKNQDETNNVLKKHKDGKVWLHSGDLGHMDQNGCVYIDGRLKRIIVRHDGIKVFPFGIEKTIIKLDCVSACCVVGKDDADHGRGKVPVAFVVLNNTSTDAIEEIKRQCLSELSENYLPKEYYVVEQLPLTPNGKIDYRALENRAEEMSKE